MPSTQTDISSLQDMIPQLSRLIAGCDTCQRHMKFSEAGELVFPYPESGLRAVRTRSHLCRHVGEAVEAFSTASLTGGVAIWSSSSEPLVGLGGLVSEEVYAREAGMTDGRESDERVRRAIEVRQAMEWKLVVVGVVIGPYNEVNWYRGAPVHRDTPITSIEEDDVG